MLVLRSLSGLLEAEVTPGDPILRPISCGASAQRCTEPIGIDLKWAIQAVSAT